jgi:hypothetical protein
MHRHSIQPHDVSAFRLCTGYISHDEVGDSLAVDGYYEQDILDMQIFHALESA